MKRRKTIPEQALEPKYNKRLFSHVLPTSPIPEIGTVLVTGASGYIGGRLMPELSARGYKVRVMVRTRSPEQMSLWPYAEIVTADALDFDSLRTALKGVNTAYYLIHSLRLGPKEFAAADIQAAANFRKAAEENNVKRIIYLGGLGDKNAQLSKHLRSRAEVEEELKRGSVPATILRAAIIIGSGSASYEIIRHLARKSPIILTPYWAKNRCQPIAVRDVIKYLVGVLEIPKTAGKSFDIGGPDILTYRIMLKTASRLFNKKALFLPSPISNVRFYSYITSFHTPVPASITHCLFGSLKNEVVCKDDSIKNYLPFKPLGYEEAVLLAVEREEQDAVRTRWSGAYPSTHASADRLIELKKPPQYTTQHSLITSKGPVSIFKSFCRIGGKEGWFRNNWMWRLRGMVDRILLGVGTARGRRSHSSLDINDVIDFWRVEDIQPNERLLLRAEMKLPGKAWLEFNVKKEGPKDRLSVIAYYDTDTFLGRVYWYTFMPFHHFIFTHLIEQIEKRS